ncbi:MAG: hypothetical protein CMI54_01670 [Parcubacteria group bacterium]|nr:hypothetical protein [Parcubacteria group bacterium]|tara:strand:+ start:21051 stop:21314 length:264 start_codon:yes stop_codon:yes gene_type:complete
MSKLKEVKKIGAKIDENTVQVLEDLLASAKTGELQAIMYVDKNNKGECGHGWAGVLDKRMIGELQSLNFCFLAKMHLVRDGEDWGDE